MEPNTPRPARPGEGSFSKSLLDLERQSLEQASLSHQGLWSAEAEVRFGWEETAARRSTAGWELNSRSEAWAWREGDQGPWHYVLDTPSQHREEHGAPESGRCGSEMILI